MLPLVPEPGSRDSGAEPSFRPPEALERLGAGDGGGLSCEVPGAPGRRGFSEAMVAEGGGSSVEAVEVWKNVRSVSPTSMHLEGQSSSYGGVIEI